MWLPNYSVDSGAKDITGVFGCPEGSKFEENSTRPSGVRWCCAVPSMRSQRQCYRAGLGVSCRRTSVPALYRPSCHLINWERPYPGSLPHQSCDGEASKPRRDKTGCRSVDHSLLIMPVAVTAGQLSRALPLPVGMTAEDVVVELVSAAVTGAVCCCQYGSRHTALHP